MDRESYRFWAVSTLQSIRAVEYMGQGLGFVQAHRLAGEEVGMLLQPLSTFVEVVRTLRESTGTPVRP